MPHADFDVIQRHPLISVSRSQPDFSRSQWRDFGGAMSPADFYRAKSDFNRGQQQDFGGTTYNQSSCNDAQIENLLAKVRADMMRHGSGDIGGIGRKFRIVDVAHSRKISREEFAKICNELSLSLTRRDIDILWLAFGFDYEEFLRVLRGEMNERRQAMVNLAFDTADADRSGIIDIGDFLDRYDADNHPDVKQGCATSAQVLKTFILNFDVGGVPDGKVTRKEFKKYYEGVSASCDSDDYFEQVVRSAWKITDDLRNQRAMNQRSDFVSTLKQKVRPYSASATLRGGASLRRAGPTPSGGVSFVPTSCAVAAGDVLKRARADLRARGSSGISGIGRLFRIVDDDNRGRLSLLSVAGSLSQEEFMKMCRDCRLKLSPQDIVMLFKAFDGYIDYEGFLKALHGPMNPRRQAIVNAAFMAADEDNSGLLHVADLICRYNANSHPENERVCPSVNDIGGKELLDPDRKQQTSTQGVSRGVASSDGENVSPLGLLAVILHVQCEDVEKAVAVPIVEVSERVQEVPQVLNIEKVVPEPQVEQIQVIKEVARVSEKQIAKRVPLTVYEVRDREVDVPLVMKQEQLVEVPTVEYHDIVKQVERVEIERVQKQVEVPMNEYVERIMEVPQLTLQEVIVEVPQVHQVDLIKQYPRIQPEPVDKVVNRVEVEYVERIVEKPIKVVEERIVEVPQVEYREIIKEVMVPQVRYIEKRVPKEIIQYTEQIVEIPQVIMEERAVEVPQVIEVEAVTQVFQNMVERVPKRVPKIQLEGIERNVEVEVQLVQEVAVEVPEVIPVECIKQVPRLEQEFVARNVPRIRLEAVEQVVHVPLILSEERLVEVPQVRQVDVVRQVPREQYQDVARQMPKVKLQVQEILAKVPKMVLEKLLHK